MISNRNKMRELKGKHMWETVHHIIDRIKSGYLREMFQEALWMFRYVKKYRYRILYYIVLGLVSTGMGFCSSILMKHLIDAITSKESSRLLVMFAFYIGFLLGSLLVNYASGLISAKIRIRVENEIRADIYHQIMEADWERIAAFHSGELLNRLNGDVTSVAGCVLDWIPNLISRVAQFAGALGIILYYDPTMVLFALLGVPATMVMSRVLLQKLRSFSRRTREVNGEMMSFNEESLQNIQTIKSFGLTELYFRKMVGAQKKYEDTSLAFARFSQKNSVLMGLLNQGVSLLCFGWCVYRLWTGYITFGTMTMFLTISSTLSASVNSLISLVPAAVNATTSAGRLREVAGLPKEELSDREAVEEFLREHGEGGLAVEAQDVDFSYQNGNLVFRRASLRVAPGEIGALVGPSGEGKTTMIRILLSLMKPEKGTLRLTAADGSSIPLSPAARTLFSYVPQGNTMFSGTIAENLRMVKEDAKDEELIRALKTACAYDFVEKLPEGIDSRIGENGGGFSEGQSQRLSIARALLRDAPILLLDEATSALDVATERQLLKNIMVRDPGKTCIVTTHRPSVLGVCSRVYRISDSQVTQVNEEEIARMMQDF